MRIEEKLEELLQEARLKLKKATVEAEAKQNLAFCRGLVNGVEKALEIVMEV